MSHETAPILSTSLGRVCLCNNCGSNREHPLTGYCFDCDSDDWNVTEKKGTSDSLIQVNSLMMTKKEIKVLSDVSKYDQKTREALATAIEIAYAAAKRGALPNEAKLTPVDLPDRTNKPFNGRFA